MRRIRNNYVNRKYDVINGRLNRKIDSILFRTEKKVSEIIKSKFGVDMTIYGNIMPIFCEWLSKYDKNFRDHVLEPYNIDIKDNDNLLTSICEEFIVKLENYTYVYVRPSAIEREELSPHMKSGSVYVYIFGKKMMKYVKELTDQLNKNIKQVSEIGYIYTVTSSANNKDTWSCQCNDINMRSFDNLFFNAGKKETIIDHLDNWKANAPIYLERDIIYKTGILLYGRAGTGKSSMASAIARYMNCNIVSIDLNTFDNLDISSVVSAINADNTRYVVLLDEIDTVFTSRDKEDSTEKQTSNTMKLLSLLDSPQSPNNVIFVATTNYIDRLDSALTRKGRFDLKLELDDMTEATAVQMCKSFKLNDNQTRIALKNAIEENNRYNPATLQDCILKATKL